LTLLEIDPNQGSEQARESGGPADSDSGAGQF